MQCRICLDDEKPFLQPCKCSGTMGYVHAHCLRHWIDIQQNEIPTCELCNTPFRMAYNRPLERHEAITLLNGYFLIYPSWHILATSICQILFAKGMNYSPEISYLYAQLLYHSLYMVANICAVFAELHSPRVYLYYIMEANIYTTFFVHVHLWLLLYLFFVLHAYHLFMVFSIVNQCYLGIYPILHSRAIYQMNLERQQILL